MSSIYKIGVEIALAGTIMQGLEAISAKLLGINLKVKDIEGGFNRWALAIGGAASVMAGVGILDVMGKVVEKGGELVKQQALLKAMGGMSDADITGATASAQLATQKVIGTTIAENLKGIRELVGVMPSLKEAQEAYPAVMQAAKVLESISGTPASESLQTIAKAIELRGGGMNAKTGELDPQRFIQEANAAQAAITASGGLVNAAALLQYMKTAGPMARMMTDPDVFYSQALTAIMDMGGFRAGTAMTAAGRQLLGGKMAKPTAEEMQSMGLLNEGSWHASGTGVVVDKGGLVGEDILKDPKQGMLAWAKQILLPALAAKGITAAADVQQELYHVFGTETTRRMMGLFIQNEAQINKDASLYYKARYGADAPPPSSYGYASVTGGSGGAYSKIAAGDIGQNVTNLKDAVQNFLEAFGAPLVPGAIAALQSMSAWGNSLAQGALAHPEAMKLIGESLVALAAGLVVFGGAAVIAAMAALAPAGVVYAGLLGLAAAGAALVAVNWSSIASGFSGAIAGITSSITSLAKADLTGFFDAFNGFAAKAKGGIDSAMASIAGMFVSAIMGIPGALAGAIGSMGASIAAAISKAFGGGGGAAPVVPPLNRQPAHPSGLSPSSPQYPQHQAAAPTIHSKTVVMLDGRVLGEAMSSQMASASTFPRQAAYNDTYVGWNAPDSNFSMA